MSPPRALIRRATVAGRRISGAPDWPLASGAFFGLLAMVEIAIRTVEPGTSVPTSMLLGLASTLPLALARSHVLAAAVTITVAAFLTLTTGQRMTVAGLVALTAVFYQLGRRRSGRASVVMVLPFVAFAIISPFAAEGPAWSGDAAVTPSGEGFSNPDDRNRELSSSSDGDNLYPAVLAFAAAAAAGLGSSLRSRHTAAERETSRRTVADSLLEHVARGERASIARELHDVVAHHISMIAVQAETARLTTPGLPDDGAKRLLAIGDTARTALTEMRRLLGVLREDAGTETTRQPAPGLQQLIELIDEARDAAGVSTRLVVRGRVVPLDPGVELTAYRLVQESLTNARRHAPGAAVDVELDYTDDAVHLRVRDNGPGSSGGASVEGHGLLGMRERALAVGGDLWAGPGSVSGFLVEARLPVAVLATATAVDVGARE